jgi:sugar lactone lactonase YvrE
LIWAAAFLAATLTAASPQARDCAPHDGLSFVCGPVGSEDIAQIPGTGWLIASGLDLGGGGHIHLIDGRSERAFTATLQSAPEPDLAAGCPGPPDPAKMSTDGLTIRPDAGGRHMLYVANHGDRRAIEMFRIDARRDVPVLTWVGCAPMPAGTLPNAVAALSGGRLIVTSFHDPDDKLAWARMARQEPTGSVWAWRPGAGFRRMDTGPISGANGVEVSRDERTLYVSAWSASRLVIIDLGTGRRREIPLDFLPDNVKRAPGGLLLVGGQRTTVASIASCTGPQCPQDWIVARVDPRRGTVTPLVERHGDALINYACTGLEVGGRLYITARGDRRIAWLPISSLPSLR